MSLLQTIRTGKSQCPPRLLIYGTEGIGKSSLGADAPKAIFVPCEDGLDNISCDSFPLCRTFSDAVSCLETLLNEPHDYRTVVLDTLDWLERLIWDQVCNENDVKSIEKAGGGFGKSYVFALTHWRRIIDMLRQLREERNMIIILLAHAQVKDHTDPNPAHLVRLCRNSINVRTP